MAYVDQYLGGLLNITEYETQIPIHSSIPVMPYWFFVIGVTKPGLPAALSTCPF